MTDTNKNLSEQKKSKITSKQVVAMIGVILLALLYVTTLILAFTDNSASGQFFAMSLCGTLVVPIIIFLYSWMYGRITGRRAIGDPDTVDTDEAAR
ncbi:MAG: hypothetical protein NC079_00360 [Clostridium sp.]|nr:hypothetical protein [Acetatifactor muris]MCM1527068.1 hypothetical protein [Bacteroides sp.]MCM1562044.1 hypothetical protein [Clostridium sp.]